jgi:CHAD domain-containing protein
MNDKPALQQDLSVGEDLGVGKELGVGEALRDYARDILAKARAAIEASGRTDAEAVHDFRREMKRWRALLRLIGPFLAEEGRVLRTEARDLARSLGGARDAQAALDGLADLAGHGLALTPRSLATVQARVEAIKQAAENTTLNREMRLRLAQALDHADASVELWPLHVLTFAEVAARLAGGYRAARRMVPENWDDASAEDLHELRKHIVTHRYQMETVVPLWRRFGKMWVGEAQRLRERLGQDQDLLQLVRLTEPHQPLAPWCSRLRPAIDERKATHVRAARRIAQRLLVEKPKAFRRKLDVMWETAG